MSKLFGVNQSHETTELKNNPHTPSYDHEVHETIEVDIHENQDHEVDIGQIAVDVLDLAEEIIIIAPVA